LETPTRDRAVRTLEEGRQRLDRLLAGVSEHELSRPATIGGGDWSAKDLIGHIALWEEAAVDAVSSVRRGEVPEIEAVFREEGGVDRYNAETMPKLQELSLDEVRERATAAHETLVALIRGMDDGEWLHPVPYETERRRNLAILLGSITGAPKRPFGHAFAHIPDLAAFISSPSR
jgi:uncharacterized protein (TIGR03083 family)